jgi:hypothetical protein
VSPSELVFPGADGARKRKDVKLEGVLRRALGREGIVLYYDHVCRKKGCGHHQRAADAALRHCPTHNFKLWPKAVVRPIRFHDLRHTTASLLMMAGVNPAAVQRILCHRDPRITTETYGHLEPGYLRKEIDSLRFERAVEGEPDGELAAEDAPRFAAQVLQGSPIAGLSPPPDAEEAEQLSLLARARHRGFEPLTYGSGGEGGSQQHRARQRLIVVSVTHDQRLDLRMIRGAAA